MRPLVSTVMWTRTQENRMRRNGDAGLIKAAHSPDFSFPADAGTFKCYQGSCSEHAANFHPHPPQPCTFLPRQQGGQVFYTKHSHPHPTPPHTHHTTGLYQHENSATRLRITATFTPDRNNTARTYNYSFNTESICCFFCFLS